MVELDIINKIVTSVLVKCGYNVIPSNPSSWNVRFPRTVRERLDGFARRTCTFGSQSEIEWYNVIDTDGSIVYENSGDEKSVNWNLEDVSQIVHDLGHPLYDVHNHPHGYFGIPVCFSEADFEAFLSRSTIDDGVYLFKGNTVETPNGSRMSIVRNSKFTVDDEDKVRVAYKKLHELYFGYGRDLKEARKSVINDVMNNNISVPLQFLDGKHNTELGRFTLDLAIQRVGGLEERLGDVRRMFNDANCEFSIEWRRDNNPYVH